MSDLLLPDTKNIKKVRASMKLTCEEAAWYMGMLGEGLFKRIEHDASPEYRRTPAFSQRAHLLALELLWEASKDPEILAGARLKEHYAEALEKMWRAHRPFRPLPRKIAELIGG